MSDTLHYKHRIKKKIDKASRNDKRLKLLKKQTGEKDASKNHKTKRKGC